MKRTFGWTFLVLLWLGTALSHAATQFSAAEYHLLPGDFNADGRTDLLYISKSPGRPNGIALADGSGAPQLGFQTWGSTFLGLPWSTGELIPTVGDFNDDGRADVFLQAATAGTSYILLSSNEPYLAPLGHLYAIHQEIGHAYLGIEWSADKHKLLVGDFDDFGPDDILLQATSRGGTNAIVLADRAGLLFTRGTSHCGWSPGPQQCWTDGEQGLRWSTRDAVLHIGKFNNDQRSDVLIQSQPKFVLIDYALPLPAATFRDASFGIFLAQTPDGAGRILRSANQLWSPSQYGASWSPRLSNLIVADFTGDGFADVFLQSRNGAVNQLAVGSSRGTIGNASAFASSVGAWGGGSYVLLPGKFSGGSRAVLYLQSTQPAGFNYLSTDITASNATASPSFMQTSAVLPALGTAAGATPGTADVTSGGASTYTIPIRLPKGTAGLTPDLALNYSSTEGNGMAGVGWSLAGLGTIVRCPETMAQDGVTRGVRLVAEDQYCLNGNRLRRVSGSQGLTGSVYRTELETYSRVTVMNHGATGPVWFKVEDRNGLIYEYGNSASSRVSVPSEPSTTRTWALSRVRDRASNYWAVTYAPECAATGAFCPERIDYTANEAAATSAPYIVRFFYGERNAGEQLMSYYQGGLVNQTRRLIRIELQSGSQALIRKYTFTYESPTTLNKISLLRSVQECSPTQCMSATTFDWTDQVFSGSVPSFDTARATNPHTSVPASEEVQVVERLSLDINGDGVLDSVARSLDQFLTVTADDAFVVTLGARKGQVGGQQYTFGMQDNDSYILAAVDWDGDGKRDVLVRNGAALWWIHQRPDGTLAFENTGTASAGHQATLTLDVDGDGFEDLVRVNQNQLSFPGSVEVRFHRRDAVVGFEPAVGATWAPPSPSRVTEWNTLTQWESVSRTLLAKADINGDGLQDLLVHMTNGWRVLYSNGSGFVTGELIVSRLKQATNSYIMPAPVDVNGDGCTDLLYPDNASTTWRLAVSTCRTLGASSLSPSITVQAVSAMNVEWTATAADMNLDGLQDIVFAPPSGIAGGGYVAVSTGSTFSSPVALGSVLGMDVNHLVDLDGDALPDASNICISGHPAEPCLTAGAAVFHANLGSKRPNLLESVTDGFGNRADFEYAALTDPSVYTRGSTATGRTQDVLEPLYVVRKMLMTDGAGGSFWRDYKYRGAKRHVGGRGFLGFAGRSVKDSRTGFHTDETYNNTVAFDGTGWQFIGTLKRRTTYQSDRPGSPIVEDLEQDWLSIDPSGPGARRFPYVQATTLREYELTGANVPYRTRTTTNVVDANGTAFDVTTTTVEGITGLNAGSTSTHRVYSPTLFNSEADWCLSKPARTEETRSHSLADGVPTTRVSRKDWAGSPCRVTDTYEGVDTAWQLHTAIEYDGFNNVGRTTTTGAGIVAPIVKEAYYGPTGHLLEWASNAKGHRTTYAWDVSLQVHTSVTDPNGLVTWFAPDDLGRERLMTRPDGTSALKSYYVCNSGNGFCGDGLLRYVVRTIERSTSGSEITRKDEFFDASSRLKYEQTLGLNGETIVVHTLYDNRGNTINKSNPYFAGGSVSGVSTTYDRLDRPTHIRKRVSESDPTIATELVTYNGLTVTTTDSRFFTRSKVSTAWGDVWRATDEAGKHTRYSHSAFGELRSVTDPAGNVSWFAYNARGFKVGTSDPDMGAWSYTYDALGQMLTQRDAKNQTTTFTYDELGRTRTRRDHPGTAADQTEWVWDTAPMGRGQLHSVTSPGGYSEVFAYDNQGRRSRLTTTANGAPYVVDYTYDAASGRPGTMTYPASTGNRLAVQYAYQYGYLKDVRDLSSPSTPLWRANAQDARGNVTQESFGNGQVSALAYDSVHGRLLAVQTGPGGGAGIQNLAYAWDGNGNLSSRRDLAQGLGETFSYDALNRLTSVQLNGSTTLVMAYNDIGNLVSKTGLGAYTYPASGAGSVRPHAVSSAGGVPYAYDANGNMSSRNGAAVEWTAYNYPRVINRAGGNSSTFYYGADRNRYREISVDGAVTEDRTTIAGVFERTVRGGQIEYRHYVQASGRTVAVVKRSAQTGNEKYYLHDDHLGSTDAITNQVGALVVRLSYDAWGRRRGSHWTGAPSAANRAAINQATHEGFTSRLQLDNLDLVHLNGRVYDPVIARFISADPIIQAPLQSQAFNRYSYTWNNPLNATDPSGFKVCTGSRISTGDDYECPLMGGFYIGDDGYVTSSDLVIRRRSADAGNNSAQAGGVYSKAAKGLTRSLDPSIDPQKEGEIALYHIRLNAGGEWEILGRVEGVGTRYVFVNGILGSLGRHAVLGAAHLVRRDGSASEFTLFNNPSENFVMDLLESAADKLGFTSEPAKALAGVLQKVQAAKTEVQWITHSQGGAIFSEAMRYSNRQGAGSLSYNSVQFNAGANNRWVTQGIAKDSGVRVEGYYYSRWDLVPNLLGVNGTPLSIAGSLITSPLLFSDQHSPHTEPTPDWRMRK